MGMAVVSTVDGYAGGPALSPVASFLGVPRPHAGPAPRLLFGSGCHPPGQGGRLTWEVVLKSVFLGSKLFVAWE